MTPEPKDLLQRLDDIGASVAQDGRALALLGVGSVGTERSRLDKYSDLDFFVVAKDGLANGLIDDLSWLEAAAPLRFTFRNTVDGHKIFFEDGIYGEFAVFTRDSIRMIPAHGERVIWAEPGFDPAMLERFSLKSEEVSAEWIAGEILTNLYVGLTRLARGEKLSAFRFVQVYAMDQLLRLLAARGPTAYPDPHDLSRRAETRDHDIAGSFPALMGGYDRTAESALAMLSLVSSLVTVDPYVKERILAAAAGH